MDSVSRVKSRGKMILDLVLKPQKIPGDVSDPIEDMPIAKDDAQPADIDGDIVEGDPSDPIGNIQFCVDADQLADTAVHDEDNIFHSQIEDIPILFDVSIIDDNHVEIGQIEAHDDILGKDSSSSYLEPGNSLQSTNPASLTDANDSVPLQGPSSDDSDHSLSCISDSKSDNSTANKTLRLRKIKRVEEILVNDNSVLIDANDSVPLQGPSSDDSDYSPSCISDSESDNSTANKTLRLRKRKRVEQIVVNDNSILKDANDNRDNNNNDPTKMKRARQHRKDKRNSGKSYATEKGKYVPARVTAPLRNSCRKKCGEKISEDIQLALFTSYWNLGSYDKRVLYIANRVRIVETATERKKDPIKSHRNRMHTIKYSVVCNGDDVDVCYYCFKSIYGETEKFLKTVIKKKKSSVSGIPIPDQRGKNTPTNKTSSEQLEKIREHIKSFPSYESHYTRRDTSKKYLPSDLTITSMHRDFLEKNNIKISISVYTTVFKSLNLSFKKPKLDTCHKCDIFKARREVAKTEEEKQSIKNDHDKHLDSADYAYKMKAKDKERSIADMSVKTLTFDLQQCLPTPHLETNVAFYKRQLYTLNLTVHDCQTSIPSCYIWHEGIAARGGNEIASCLYKHLKNIPDSVRHCIFYSDTCPGQNRNSHVAAMFLTYMADSQNIEIIDHKFLVPGHTHTECDSDHALIERKKKSSHLKIHHPHDWAQLISTVGRKKSFEVVELDRNNFFQFSNLLKGPLIMKKIDTENNKFSWNSVQWLRYTKEPGVFFYKCTLEEDKPFYKMNFRRRSFKSHKFSSYLTQTEEVFITKEKKADIMSLLPLISPVFHDFYKGLKTAKDARDMLPDIDYDSDE